MPEHLKRCLIVGIVVVLLAGACSSDGDSDEGAGNGSGAAPTLAPGGEGDGSGSVSTPTPGNGGDGSGSAPTPAPVASALGVAGSEQGTLLTVRLSEGDAIGGLSSPAVNRVDGRPLDAAEIRAVTDRLPPWVDDDADAVDFNRPAESLPPPRTGETIDRPFPAGPDIDAPDVDPGPLAVLRVQPEGDVGIAPFVSITFNQPMVPLATVAQLDDLDVPATITPSLPGRWQWIGTRTLRFEHDPEIFDRLPMATSYVVEVPAGTTSQSGGELATAVRFEFETPAPNMTWLVPQHDSLDLQPVFLVAFDQRIEPAAALEAITLTADGDPHRIRLATAAEIEDDEHISSRLGCALDDTWVAFRPATPLEPDSSIRIEVGPHVPSAEGPNTSSDSSVVEARTYAPLRLEESGCSYRGCRPGWSLRAWFNNTLDAATLDAADISITPELPGATVSVHGNTITIAGPTAGGTVYEVVIPERLGDVFGQRLGEPETVEFSIDEALPHLSFTGGLLATVDPLGVQQTVPVMVRQWEQLRVRLYPVEPSDYGSFLDFVSSQRRRDRSPVAVPWPAAVNEIVETGIDDDALTEFPIDLSGALNGEHGHVVMIVDGAGRLAETDTETNRTVMAWVQDTDIGVDMITDYRDVAVWTTDLRTGDPLAGVEIELKGRTATLTTDADGVARASLSLDGHEWIVATLGADRALNPVNVAAWPREDQTIWYTADDRGIFRPGETLHLKGWVRNLDLSGDGDLEFLPRGELVTYRVSGPFGNDLGSGEVRLDDHGGFDLTVDLPEGANLGWSSIFFERRGDAGGGWHYHYFQVQEFRRPEFEVEARLESAGPHLVDEPAVAAVDAMYFSGGPLPDAEVTWTVTTRQGSYSPPNWSGFTFGVWRPWWYFGHFDEPWTEPQRKTFTGRTDSSGSHYLRMDFEGDGDHLPTMVTAEARVLDVNRQQWASATDVLVHPASLYVGVRSARTFVRAGDTLDIDAVVTDIDGNPVPGRSFEITAARIVYQHVDGQWTEVAVDAETCEVVSEQTPVGCEFAADIGGRYRISAVVADDAGRKSRSELTRWVSGARSGVPSRRIDLEVANLIPDAESYAAGDTAEILVDSPFASGTGLLTIAHNQIIELRTFEIADHAAVLEVAITDDHVPELAVQVEIVSTTERTADDGTSLDDVPHRPAYASGQALLRVPPLLRTLDVTAEPASTAVEPGAATSIAVEVNDAGGAPVEGANVLLIVVDEAVLAVSGYQLLDPISVFYRPWTARLGAIRSRGTILLESPQDLLRLIDEDLAEPQAEEALAESAAADGSGQSGPAGLQVDVRENLDALALFDPDATTDAAGRVTVEFDLPDSLTRYRVMAVAVHGAERFGTAESAITARLPLQVRPSAPRFLNYGDEFELPIVVQNQTDSAMDVDVVVQASNLELVGSPGRRVTVPANDRVEVRFPARADSPGTARFRAVAVSGDHADAQIVSLPVYTPATSEAFATYGVVDEGAVIQSIAALRDVIPQFGGLEINTSSTALQALTDAVLYLTEYRYASSDAYASRILAISALRDVLGAFDAEGLASPEELDAAVRRDIAELSALQHSDGGFGWWRRDRPSSPYQSIQAMHALTVARNEGFAVSEDVLASGYWYLQGIEDRIPAGYSQRSRDMLSAYALHVRSLAGYQESRAALALWQRRGTDLGLDALAWIWPVVDDDAVEASIERVLNNRVVETAGAASFVTDYGEDAYLLLHSDRRTDAIVLDALITMAPESDLIAKVVAGLLANRIKGRWNNVQENSFILLALNRYFAAFEATDPDFVARVWLGDLYAAQHQFSGRSTDRALTLVPMAELLAEGDSDLIVSKDGEGRLYYRLGLRYAPDDLSLDPLDRGFVVQRSYEAVDDPGDVRLDDDGVWHVRAGAQVRVNVTMVNDSRRTNMALVDPMPAGFESLNPALAVTGEVDARRDGAAGSWWWWTWYEHQNLRDDRAEAFSSYLWAGTHEYSYVVRATTPGTFVVPPAKAEEIYAPEVFGRSRTDTVIVQDQP